ncbi:MAG: thioesterase family protein [Betaproteobacteria bacterium]|nr:thioesterase family protein [Betaproteobacteria bacterium]
MPHPLDEAIGLTPTGTNTYSGATHPAYANMVGPFGGVTTAVLLNAALLHPSRLGDPIALTVNFAGPVADGPFDVEAVPVRTNRSTQHWTLLLKQGDVVCTSGSAVFAVRRDTWSDQEAVAPRDMPPVDSLARLQSDLLPPWVRCYDMRFPPGEEPFRFDEQAQQNSNTRLWVRDEPPRPLDFAGLAAICDNFFPRIFDRRHRPVPVGTVTLTAYLHADAGMLAAQGSRHVLGTARALHYRNGYFDQSAEIWGDDGCLLASTHQMVYYRA